MQVIEGEENKVRKLSSKIEEDPRHHGYTELRWEMIQKPHFPDWSMGFKSLEKVDVAQTPGYGAFMDEPLTSPRFQTDPSRAEKLCRRLAPFWPTGGRRILQPASCSAAACCRRLHEPRHPNLIARIQLLLFVLFPAPQGLRSFVIKGDQSDSEIRAVHSFGYAYGSIWTCRIREHNLQQCLDYRPGDSRFFSHYRWRDGDPRKQ
jgi:hypothetical protein